MFRPLIYAEENRSEITFDFRVNVSRIDTAFGGNSAAMSSLRSIIDRLGNDSTLNIVSVELSGAASPEGSYDLNRRLAAGRLAAVESLLRNRLAIPDSLITRDTGYIPWHYLRHRVEISSHPRKDTVLAIIDEPALLVTDPANGKRIDRRVVRLRSLDNGAVWRELFSNYFSAMRNAGAVITTRRPDRRAPLLAPVAGMTGAPMARPAPPAAPLAVKRAAAAPVRARKPFYMDVSTNMLYDALAVPNLGIEFHLGKNWSVGAGYMHAWWSHDRRHRYWRIYGGELSARRWLGSAARRKPLTGHHIGLYIQAYTFDFEFGGKAYMGGEPGGTILDRAHFGAGIEYGYSLPVARRLNIDFSIGAGYTGGRVYEFVPETDRYVWTATKNRRWFGPTKLAVSLVWLIGHGNENTRGQKGGGRP